MYAPLPRSQHPTTAPDEFWPEFCPIETCSAHLPGKHRFTRAGRYKRVAGPQRVQRFKCHSGRHTFSTQSFSPTRYLKRPELLLDAARLLANGCADRQIRRFVRSNPHYTPKKNVGAAASTITRLVPRIAREAALWLTEMEALARAAGAHLVESVTLDDFETFAVSQLNQVSVPTVIGRKSGYIYQFDQAPHRWHGRLCAVRKQAERELARRGAFVRGARQAAWKRVMTVLLDLLAPGGALVCVSDGDHTIARVLASIGARVHHRAFPNPPRRRKHQPRSRAARIRDGQMAPVDLLHRWFRHATAHDRRETIAFSQSVNALLSRKLIFALQKNLIQPRFERKGGSTPAMIRKLLPEPLNWDEILEMRRFPKRSAPLPPGWDACYREQILTIGKAPSPRRFPKYAH